MSKKSKIRRVSDDFVELFEKAREKGEVATFPEFTRMTRRELQRLKQKRRREKEIDIEEDDIFGFF